MERWQMAQREPKLRAKTDYDQPGPQGHQVVLCEKDGMRYMEMMAESEGEVEDFPVMARYKLPENRCA